MKKAILTVIAAGLMSSAAMGTNINISVQQTNGTNAITVAPGATVNYKVVGTLSDALNEGLALIGLSLDFTGGPLTPANTPTGADFSCLNPMRNFVMPEGMSNPGGYGGTVMVGAPPCPDSVRACLIQAGGAQNTIENTVANASFPVGTVLTGVAQPGGCGPAVILTGSLTAPQAVGTYHLNAFDVFANVIRDGETENNVFWATDPAGAGTTTNLAVTVALPCDVARWESVITHVRTGVDPIIVPLNIPNDGTFSESRSGVKKVLVTFNGTINAATATAANLVVCGMKPDLTTDPVTYVPVDLGPGVVTITAAAVAGNTQMEINFAAALPNFARYKIALDGVECSGGGAAQAGDGGLTRIFTALQGDANGSRNVSATDLGAVRPLVGTDPIDPAVLNQVRFDVNNSKNINATDLGSIRGKVGNDARNIPEPVCP